MYAGFDQIVAEPAKHLGADVPRGVDRGDQIGKYAVEIRHDGDLKTHATFGSNSHWMRDILIRLFLQVELFRPPARQVRLHLKPACLTATLPCLRHNPHPIVASRGRTPGARHHG